MEELKRVQELRIDEFSTRRLIENQDTINELTARIQELQNEVNHMNDSRDFKDAESVRSGLSHVPSQPASFPRYRDLGGMRSRDDIHLSSPGTAIRLQGMNIGILPPDEKIKYFEELITSKNAVCKYNTSNDVF